jgi:hypothetical protein
MAWQIERQRLLKTVLLGETTRCSHPAGTASCY